MNHAVTIFPLCLYHTAHTVSTVKWPYRP